jgi:hypothetical protein
MYRNGRFLIRPSTKEEAQLHGIKLDNSPDVLVLERVTWRVFATPSKRWSPNINPAEEPNFTPCAQITGSMACDGEMSKIIRLHADLIKKNPDMHPERLLRSCHFLLHVCMAARQMRECAQKAGM